MEKEDSEVRTFRLALNAESECWEWGATECGATVRGGRGKCVCEGQRQKWAWCDWALCVGVRVIF